jgi:Sugar (and other) transporter
VTLALGAVPAAVILFLRHELPETAIWLIRHGRFREAKQVTMQMYGDRLEMLLDNDVTVPKPRLTAFLADLSKDPIRWRASLFGYIACFCQGSEFSTFAFYLPVLFVSLGVSSILGTDLVTMGLYVIAAISGWVGPMLTPKIGHRGISIWASASCSLPCWWRQPQSTPAIKTCYPSSPRPCSGGTTGTRPTA